MSQQPQSQQSQEQILQSVFNPTGGGLQTIGVTNWTSYHVPSTATQATIAKAAGGLTVRHVCNSITASISCGTTAQTPIQVYLRDGTTGAGTILWAATLAAPANGVGGVSVSGLYLVGTANTAMTLEFSAAGVTSSQEVVTLTGYDIV
jgi:hypothetical protein